MKTELKDVMDAIILREITTLVKYNWPNEWEDYVNLKNNGKDTQNHIFHTLVTLSNLIEGTTWTADHLWLCFSKTLTTKLVKPNQPNQSELKKEII
tara:strand:- start:97 stop:384 length:288 start_codon:yes stop_codon:yes gene_type:complete